MRRCQKIPLTTDQWGITIFVFKTIEPCQVMAGTIHKKAHQLKKKIINRNAFFVFSYGTKHFFHYRDELNTLQVSGKECQPAAIGKAIIGGGDRTDMMVFLRLFLVYFTVEPSAFWFVVHYKW